MEGTKTPLSVDVDKKLLLKFKSMCVLKETTMSEEVESLIREWVRKNGGSAPQQAAPAAPPEDTGRPMPPMEAPETAPDESVPNEKEKAFL